MAAYAKVVGVRTISTKKRVECKLSRRVEKISDGSVSGFGCSDCGCRSHLYYFVKNPDVRLAKL
jgi:sugar fermentation stimulation protein A